MDMTIHPNSPLDAAQQRYTEAQTIHATCTARVAELSEEQARLQSTIDRATLETDPAALSATQARLGVVERYLSDARRYLDNATRRLEADEQRHTELSGQLTIARQQLATLRDLDNFHARMLRIVDHQQRLAQVQEQIRQLTGADAAEMPALRLAVVEVTEAVAA